MRKKLIIAGIIIATFTLIFTIFMVNFNNFQNQLYGYNKIKIDDKENRVLYLLGIPTHVLEPSKESPRLKWVYEVNGLKGDKNSMPLGTKIENYNEWCYESEKNSNQLNIEFDSTRHVNKIRCFSENRFLSDWGPIAGIYSGDSEDKIFKLGRPTLDSIDHVTRIIGYSDIGLEFYLTKGQVYMVKISQPRKGKTAVINRFLKKNINSIF